MNELALFAGAGGGILGGHLLGWRTVCAVEWEPYPSSVLCARQNDGFLPPFPIWDDVQTFDGKPWRGIVDVVSGGFPCQDISAAGRGAGIDGERSGMWSHMARIVGEVRPRFVYVENSPMLTARGLHRVLGDLAALGFDARWGVVSAAYVGAPHKRDRIWIVAHAASGGRSIIKDSKGSSNQFSSSGVYAALAQREGLEGLWSQPGEQKIPEFGDTSPLADAAQLFSNGGDTDGSRRSVPESRNSNGAFRPYNSWWDVEPDMGRVANGVAARVDRLKAIGNGQVPAVAATAWRLLNDAP
jgi:DNA (cytosine-5)-methyltransferase 1